MKIPINQLKQESVLIGSFYETGINGKWMVMLSMGGMLLIIGGFYVIKYRKKDSQSTENMVVSPFNSQERSILKALIAQQENGGLDNQEIHELLGISHKTVENQRKIKNEFIKSLNAKLLVI